jgi:hypothetical protein
MSPPTSGPSPSAFEDVASCDLSVGSVGIFAHRYGYIPDRDKPDRSITELEYPLGKSANPAAGQLIGLRTGRYHETDPNVLTLGALMVLVPMPESDIRRAIDKIIRKKQIALACITLTDGACLYGWLSHWSSPMRARRRFGSESLIIPWESIALFAEPGALEQLVGNRLESPLLILNCHMIGHEYKVFVPLSSIAGIGLIRSKQKQLRIEDTSNYGSFGRNPDQWLTGVLLRSSVLEARTHDFPVARDVVLYSIGVSRPFEWGDIYFKDDTPLYSDWEFLSKKAGGLNSLGVGVPLGSLSAGWDKSLWGSFRKKVKENGTRLESVCTRSELTVSGHVTFFGSDGDETPSDALVMEGGEWEAGIVTPYRVWGSVVPPNYVWVLAYFRRDAFMFPRQLWEKIGLPIRIYGERVGVPVKTEYGSVDCYIKVRAVAHQK